MNRNLGDVTAYTDLTVTEFKELVQEYRNTDDKVVKSKIEKAIEDFKNQIINSILDKGDRTKLRNLHQQRNELQGGMLLFETKYEREKRKKRLKSLINKLLSEKLD
ncbi:hypothetical protein [Leuconostoc mesenteroides]|uniref:hypothetical protein n=1 Tax=Leuconostoc mesenteroides TaxID=1245 RepID=UPI002943ADF6|nr:hypothetical protein [Leuconostoc mesenteroides]